MSSFVKEFASALSAFLKLETPEPTQATTAKNLERLLMISQGMTHYRDLDQVLGYILTEIRDNFTIDCGVLVLENERLYRVRAHRGFSADFVSNLSAPLGEGTLGLTAASGQGFALSREQFSQIPELEPTLKATQWECLLVSPIMLQSQNLGLFIAGSNQPNFFNQNLIELLKPYLQILSVGMRNVQMIEMVETFNRRLTAEVTSTTQELTQTNARLIRRVRELKALYEITLSASMQTNLEDLLESVSSKIADFFNIEQVGFLINVSPKNRQAELSLDFPSFGLSQENQARIRIPVDAKSGPLLENMIQAFNKGENQYFSGGPVSLGKECSQFIKDSASAQILDKIVIRSMIASPLKTAQGVHGVLILANPILEAAHKEETGALSDEDLRTLTLVAIRIATAIENTDLEAQNRKRLQDLSALQEINEAFYATPVLEFILAKIVRVVLQTFKCELCDFLLLESSSTSLVSHPIKENEPPGESISIKDPHNLNSQVFSEKKSKIVENIEESFTFSREGREQKIRSIMLIPLKVENDVIGVLRLGSSQDDFFEQDLVRLIELIADRSAVIVHNARLYEKIIAANQELERLNQVKTEFVSMVSHELRTPVTAIKGFVDVVLGEDAGPINAQQKRFLSIAHNSIERLSLLISDLLDISRIESGQMKVILMPASIDKIMQDSYITYKDGIEAKRIKFELKIDKIMPMVVADESRVKQVIDNLISNAMKFTKPNGTIKMTGEDLGDFVLISVEDNGVGINKDDQEKIFSMFYQVDSSLTRKVGGTGLGLAISRSIIEMHGGRIWVESIQGHGAIFRFILPRHRESQIKDV